MNAKKNGHTKVRRRDRAGHMDPKYAADLLKMGGDARTKDGHAFLAHSRSTDGLVEGLGEEFVEEATSAEYEARDYLDSENTEEWGGPFVETPADVEFAHGTDASNPKNATREPFPKT